MEATKQQRWEEMAKSITNADSYEQNAEEMGLDAGSEAFYGECIAQAAEESEDFTYRDEDGDFGDEEVRAWMESGPMIESPYIPTDPEDPSETWTEHLFAVHALSVEDMRTRLGTPVTADDLHAWDHQQMEGEETRYQHSHEEPHVHHYDPARADWWCETKQTVTDHCDQEVAP
jgi:hypothetical protein